MQQEPKAPRERAEDLIRLLVPDWRPASQQILWAIRIGIVLSLLVAIGYSYDITLWDWLKLLIVPAVIAAGGIWFNQQQREREVAAEKRAQKDALLRDFRRELLQAYNEVKKVKRMLRANKNDDAIDAKIYASQMQKLNDVQLHFEFLREEAKALFPSGDTRVHELLGTADRYFPRVTRVHELLGTADRYLQEIVEEDREVKEAANNKSEKGSKRISKLSGLQDFIREPTGPRYVKEVHLPVRAVSNYVLTKLLSEEDDEKQRKDNE